MGVGDTSSAPPYLALVAMLASTLFGSTGLAVTVLLIAAVPLAGFTAYFASRPLVESRLLRAWAAVVYAFLPAATGALAGGRIGTAVLAVLLPLMARAGIAASGLTHASGARGSWRATWAYTLLLTITTAFTPIVWPIALLLGLALLVVRRGEIAAYGVRFLAQFGVPLLVLAPWSLSLLPFGFFQEAGLEYGSGAAGALDLLGASPGGPGTVSGLMLIGVVLAALAALLRTERQFGIWTAWAVALVALVFAVLSNSSAWAGPATLVYGLALLAAAALGADGARSRVAEQSFGWRQPVAALIAFAAAAGPLLLAAGWMISGADGPLERREPVQVPAFVAEESGTRDQARTLVLASDSTARVGYTLVRGSGARLGDGELAAQSGENALLDKVVANLVAGSGADQADELGDFAVRYVLVHRGAPRQVSRVLDATPGLSRLSQRDGGALWRVDQQVSRAAIVPASGSGDPQPVAAGPVDIHTTIPAGSGSRVLRLADAVDESWTATLDGEPLTPTTLDGWAQGFELPSSGGSWTSPSTPRSATPPGCGRRARSPSSSSSWPCRAAAGTSTTTSPRKSARSPPRPPPARAAAPADCAPRRRPTRPNSPTTRPSSRRTPSSCGGGPGRDPAPAALRRRMEQRGLRGHPVRGLQRRPVPERPAVPAGHLRPGVPGGPLPERPVRPVRVRRFAADDAVRPDVHPGLRPRVRPGAATPAPPAG